MATLNFAELIAKTPPTNVIQRFERMWSISKDFSCVFYKRKLRYLNTLEDFFVSLNVYQTQDSNAIKAYIRASNDMKFSYFIKIKSKRDIITILNLIYNILYGKKLDTRFIN